MCPLLAGPRIGAHGWVAVGGSHEGWGRVAVWPHAVGWGCKGLAVLQGVLWTQEGVQALVQDNGVLGNMLRYVGWSLCWPCRLSEFLCALRPFGLRAAWRGLCIDWCV